MKKNTLDQVSNRAFWTRYQRWLAFHSPYACSQAKTGGEGPSLFSTRNKISQRHGLRKVWMWRTVSPLNSGYASAAAAVDAAAAAW